MNENNEAVGKQPVDTPPEQAGSLRHEEGQAATPGAPGGLTVAPESAEKQPISVPPGGWGGKNPPPPECRFPPGVSGNPNGHKKGMQNYRANFKKLLSEVAEYTAPAGTIKLIQKHFPSAPADMKVQMAEALRIHVAMLNGEAWAFNQVHGRELSLELNANMTVGLHDLSDDELQRRITDIARREVIAGNGETAPEMPQ